MRKLTALTAALALITPVASEAKTLEELLVEKGVIAKGEVASATKSGTSKVYYNDGTTFDFPTSGFTTKINTYIDTRYTATDADGGQDTSSFSVKRARVILSGSALHEEFSYYLAGDFVGGSDADGSKGADLVDAFIQWNACDWGGLRMGQFKTLSGNQFIAADNQLQFPDRAQATNAFALGRQQGLAGMASFDEITVSAGIFNGLSEGEGINREGVDTRHTGQLAVRYATEGYDSYTEGDIDQTEGVAFGAGAAYSYSEYAVTGFTDAIELHSFNADFGVKSEGLSFLVEGFLDSIDTTGASSADPYGIYGQVGYFLVPKKFEVAGRFGYVDTDGATGYLSSGTDDQYEYAATLNYHWNGHNLKSQIAYTHLDDNFAGGGDSNDNIYQLALTGYF